MDETTRRELRRKQLCFTCKEPWDPTDKCMGKGKAHYIEVIYDEELEEGFSHLHKMEANSTENPEEEDASHDLATYEKGNTSIHQWGTQIQHLQDERGVTRAESSNSH
jgi:hypothetical protein